MQTPKKLILLTIVVSALFFTGCGDVEEIDTTTEKNTLSIENVPNEQYYKYLWHIDSKNSSQERIAQEVEDSGAFQNPVGEINPEADINILDAWKITKGSGVKVAVIDDGGDIEHEDLKANIIDYYNIDNDNTDVSNQYYKDTDALHGNTCAGFISAPINETGIIGTAPESKLIIIKQLEDDDEKTIKAFKYAKDSGAKVVSCSWGYPQGVSTSESVISSLKSLYEAGITVVFASGNYSVNYNNEEVLDISEYDSVIGVGASAENNDVTWYSNYGNNIDLIAPGGDYDNSIGILGLDDTGDQGSRKTYGLVSDSYAFTDGTSFAAPIVAGVITLMYSVHPDITPEQVRDILISTADKVGGSNANYDFNGFDTKRAYGKINALKAVQAAQALVN